MLLDQIRFKHQRFKLRIRHNILKPADALDHLLNLHALSSAALEILPHTVAQADRLSHINNIVMLVMHDIYAGAGRQLFQFFFYIKHAVVLSRYKKLPDCKLPIISFSLYHRKNTQSSKESCFAGFSACGGSHLRHLPIRHSAIPRSVLCQGKDFARQRDTVFP